MRSAFWVLYAARPITISPRTAQALTRSNQASNALISRRLRRRSWGWQALHGVGALSFCYGGRSVRRHWEVHARAITPITRNPPVQVRL